MIGGSIGFFKALESNISETEEQRKIKGLDNYSNAYDTFKKNYENQLDVRIYRIGKGTLYTSIGAFSAPVLLPGSVLYYGYKKFTGNQ